VAGRGGGCNLFGAGPGIFSSSLSLSRFEKGGGCEKANDFKTLIS
jgi:hypothetical protein